MANLLASGAYWRCDGDCQDRAEHARRPYGKAGTVGCALSEEDSHPLKTLISGTVGSLQFTKSPRGPTLRFYEKRTKGVGRHEQESLPPRPWQEEQKKNSWA